LAGGRRALVEVEADAIDQPHARHRQPDADELSAADPLAQQHRAQQHRERCRRLQHQ